MKKLLITKRLTALLWTLVLTLMPMSLMADNTPLSVTVKNHSAGFEGEFADRAFDGNYKNKWCGPIPTPTGIKPFVEVELTQRSKLDYYYLYTGNDINYTDKDGQQQRNPKEWKLYAKVNEGDDWTLISHVTDAGLPTTVSTRSNNYKIDATYQNIEYNYLKFEILQIEQGNIFEVGEICFVNCTNHSGELVPEVPATCTENGRKAYRICTECGKRVDENGNEVTDEELVIPAAGHTFGNFIPAKEPTCMDAGYIAHQYCSVCKKDFDMDGNYLGLGDWIRDPIGHNQQWVITKDATCTEEGETSLKCLICGEIIARAPTDALGHDYDEGVVTKEPTCTETGTKKLTCLRCEETHTEEVALVPHNYNVEDLVCTVCGHEIEDDYIIEYTATEKLSVILGYGEEEKEFDYTDKLPEEDFPDYQYLENLGEYSFGVPAIKHEYDETTKKGRIICNAPVTEFRGYTELRPERLTSITLPSTLEYIGFQAFDNNCNLTSITLLAEFSDKLDYYLDFFGCNKLQEIIVPYNSYADYVEAYKDSYCTYDEEDGMRVQVHTTDYITSPISLDDTKEFQMPTSEIHVNATLLRTFSNDGWYSLCLPFSVFVENTPFSQVAEFCGVEGDTYKFKTIGFFMLDAGTPYIVKVDAEVKNPTFKNVYLTTVAPATNGAFVGVYSPTKVKEGDLAIGTGNTVRPMREGTMKGFRAYFPQPSADAAKAMRFTVDDGEATVVQSPIEATDYKLQTTSSFNLAGQKVDENYRGIVVRNGKKYMNK